MNDDITDAPSRQHEGIHRLGQVAALLYQAQHEVMADPDKDPFYGLSLGAVMDVVEDVLEILPPDLEIEHRRACGDDPLLLLRQGEIVLTGASIAAYPPGTSPLVSQLIDTAREMAVGRGLPYPPPGGDDE